MHSEMSSMGTELIKCKRPFTNIMQFAQASFLVDTVQMMQDDTKEIQGTLFIMVDLIKQLETAMTNRQSPATIGRTCL